LRTGARFRGIAPGETSRRAEHTAFARQRNDAGGGFEDGRLAMIDRHFGLR
jgi:hypothetical protein